MRKTSLAVAIVLAVISLEAAAIRADTAAFTPSQPGQVFTVINYRRAQGRAQPTVVTVEKSTSRKSKTVVPPYRVCDTRIPAGFVLKMRNPGSFTLSTDGDVVRGPFTGELPLEVLHRCYKLVLF